MTDLPGYDAWKTTEPRRPSGPAVKCKCLDCGGIYTGADAYYHHRENYHAMVLAAKPDLRIVFSCCREA